MRQAQGIYMISVVAETLDMHPQTLRKYERAGFVDPLRMGSLRTYSDSDIARLRLIKHFVEDLGAEPSRCGIGSRHGHQTALAAGPTDLPANHFDRHHTIDTPD